mgnify:CR=1 FL=1
MFSINLAQQIPISTQYKKDNNKSTIENTIDEISELIGCYDCNYNINNIYGGGTITIELTYLFD